MRVAPESHEVLVRGQPVEVWRAPGEGASLVLVHGAAGHRDSWRPLWDALAPAPRVAVSLPGRPGSDAPAAATAAGAAEWLIEVMNALDLTAPGPVLVGHSYGGAVALEVALSGFELSGLVLVATGAKLRVAPSLLAAAEEATGPMPMDAAFAPATSREVVAAYHAASAQTPASAALADWRACDCFDVRARLSELETRALIVHGDADPMTPTKFQIYLEEQIRGATRREVPGTGHMVPWEAEGPFAEAVLDFRIATALSR